MREPTVVQMSEHTPVEGPSAARTAGVAIRTSEGAERREGARPRDCDPRLPATAHALVDNCNLAARSVGGRVGDA